jgi:hypothetical protein
MRAWRVAWLTLLAAAMVGCGSTARTAPIPTEGEARGLLARIVAAAERRDFAALCSFGDPNCPDILEMAGIDRVPAVPPTVAGTRLVAPTQVSDGGLILQLCGTDGRGDPYATEMLVFTSASGLRAIQPVYWSGMGIATSPIVGQNEPLVFPGCP